MVTFSQVMPRENNISLPPWASAFSRPSVHRSAAPSSRSGAAPHLLPARARPVFDNRTPVQQEPAEPLGTEERGSLAPALDCRLGLRVENVKPGRAHGKAQLV